MELTVYVIFKREFIFTELKPIPKKKEDAPSVICQVFTKKRALEILDSMTLEERANHYIEEYDSKSYVKFILYQSIP